jgi:predicted ester cyclase
LAFPPSGRHIVVSGMSMDCISEGKIAENWTNWGAVEMLQQIDVIPES